MGRVELSEELLGLVKLDGLTARPWCGRPTQDREPAPITPAGPAGGDPQPDEKMRTGPTST